MPFSEFISAAWAFIRSTLGINYDIAMSIASSLMSDAIINALAPAVAARVRIKNEKLWACLKGIAYFLVFLALLFVCLCLFALVRVLWVGSNFCNTAFSYGKYMVEQFLVPILVVPLTIRIISGSSDSGESQRPIRWRWGLLIALLGGVMIVFAPIVVMPRNAAAADFGIDGMIYTKKFYDVNRFVSNAAAGYAQRTEEDAIGGNGDAAQPLGPIDENDFNSLMNAVIYYSGAKDDVRAKECLDRAYRLFLEGRANGGDVGMMWWYKGSFEDDAQWYYNAGEEYERHEAHYNAAMSFASAYEKGLGGVERPLRHYLECARRGERIEEASRFLLNAYNREGDLLPYLDDFAALLPDSLAVQLLKITSRIEDMDEEDIRILERFESDPRYRDCPKLIIMKGFGNVKKGEAFRAQTRRLANLHREKPGFFEPEDVINAAWLMFCQGNYGEAMDMLGSAEVSNQPYLEKGLLTAAIYLMGEVGASEQWTMEMYQYISYSQAGFEAFYGRQSVLIYEVIKAYLANAAGAPADALGDAFEQGRYGDVVSQCDELLKLGYADDSVALMKAEALIELGKRAEDGQARLDNYAEAEQTLRQRYWKDDEAYCAVLERLRDLYLLMPDRETELRIVTQKISAAGEKLP